MNVWTTLILGMMILLGPSPSFSMVEDSSGNPSHGSPRKRDRATRKAHALEAEEEAWRAPVATTTGAPVPYTQVLPNPPPAVRRKGPSLPELKPPAPPPPLDCAGLETINRAALQFIKAPAKEDRPEAELELGSGRFSSVYQGVWAGKIMAFKVFLPLEKAAEETEFREKSLAEVRRQEIAAAAGLAPRVEKPLFCLNQFIPTYAFGMELISREMTASKYFESIRGTPDQQKKTSRFFRVALKALADLHATGIFHHDITDENLFVQLDDADHLVSVRFIDFGVITSHDGNQHYRIQGDIVYSTASLDSIALVLLYLQGEGLYTVPRSTQWTLEQVSAAVSASSLEPDLQRQTLAQMDLILGEFPIPKILDPAGVGNPGDAEFKDPLAELPQAPPKDPVPE